MWSDTGQHACCNDFYGADNAIRRLNSRAQEPEYKISDKA